MNGNEKNKNVLAVSIIPAIFVLLWSSGFVVAKQGLAHAEPLTFLFWRFLIASAIMLVITRIVKAEWPRSIKEYLHTLAAGILVQLAYFGGCWLAMDSNHWYVAVHSLSRRAPFLLGQTSITEGMRFELIQEP